MVPVAAGEPWEGDFPKRGLFTATGGVIVGSGGTLARLPPLALWWQSGATGEPLRFEPDGIARRADAWWLGFASRASREDLNLSRAPKIGSL